MRAKIKSYHSPDVDDLQNFAPDDQENFSFLLELTVGADHEDGADNFSLQICTPQWLLSTMKKEDIIFLRHFLMVMEYNFERIFYKVKQKIESCAGDNWEEVVAKVSRIAYWEFEDYIE